MKGVGELVPQYYMPSPMYSPQQQRLAYLEQQQSYNSVPQQQIYLKGRPVASIDEARASMIDFDGSVFYFPDLANNRIYTKQINLDGTSTLRIYEMTQQKVPTPPSEESANSTEDLMKSASNLFVSKDDFSKTISALCAEIDKLKEGNLNNKPHDEPANATTYEF